MYSTHKIVMIDYIIKCCVREQARNVEKKSFMRQKCRKKIFGDWSNGDVKKRIKHFILGFD